MAAPDKDGPNPPVFFFSYARQRPLNNPVAMSAVDAEVRQFFTRLSEDVAQLLPRLPGEDPGFMDAALPAGTPWPASTRR